MTLSRSRYDTDKATYHVSATLSSAKPEKEIADNRALEKAYLGLWDDCPKGKGLTDPGRQILHCCFGSVLCDPKLGPMVKQSVARESAAVYADS